MIQNKPKLLSHLIKINALLLAFIVMLLTVPFAAAQQQMGLREQTREDILQIAHTIESQNLVSSYGNYLLPVPSENTAVEDAMHIYRLHAVEALETGDMDTVTSSLSALKALATQNSSERNLKFSQVLENYIELSGLKITNPNHGTTLDVLRSLQNDTDWYVRNLAMLHEALIQMNSNNLEQALKLAQDAIKLIPQDTSLYAQEARYETNILISTLYLYSANLELATPAMRDYIATGISLGRQTDGLTVLNNLNFALQSWREFDLSRKIAHSAYRLSKNSNSADQIKAIFRYSQALNAAETYDAALKIANEGLAMAEPNIWQLHLKSQQIIAQAGQGDLSAARKSLADFETMLGVYPELENRFSARMRQTDALLAVGRGDAQTVYNLMNEKLTFETQRLLRQSSDETQKLLGTLENEKSLQKAREDKLQLERSLAVARADAIAKRNSFLRFIVAFMAIGIALAMWFGAYQKKVAKQAARLRKMAEAGEQSKSQFLAVMSHELRTPLNGIIGLADMLAREGPTKDVRFKNGVILKSGLSLLDLLTNILDMSQMETGKLNISPSPTNIRDLMNNLEQLWHPRAQQQNISFSVHVEESVPQALNLDPLRMRQCLENLISNAIKFTSKGRVHVQLSYGPDLEGRHGTAPTGTDLKNAKKHAKHRLTCFVADTGKGMSAEEMQGIFDAFSQADSSTTRQFGGSGLGLAITRSLARMMNGDVTVKSVKDRGTEFTFTLLAPPSEGKQATDLTRLRPTPKENILIAEAQHVKVSDAVAAQQSPTSHPKASPKPSIQPAGQPPHIRNTAPHKAKTVPKMPVMSEQQKLLVAAGHPSDSAKRKPAHHDVFKGLRVLIVDDIRSNHDVIKIFLAPAGCIITSAMDGLQAVQATQNGHFDLILMDVRMPNMNGIEAIQTIKRQGERQAKIPIIAMTADISAENNAQCMAAGANVFLTKPVVTSELFGAIRFVLKRKELNTIANKTLSQSGSTDHIRSA